MNIWWQRFTSNKIRFKWPTSIAFAVLCVALATLARLLLGWLIGVHLTFGTYFPAVLFAALFGGVIAGILAIPLSIIVGWYAFTVPYFEFGKLTSVDVANFSVFAVSSLIIVWLAEIHRRLIQRYELQEKERKLLVGEVQHRGRNVMAVVEMLIQQIVDDSDKAMTLINRVRATVNTQDILDSSPGHNINLRDLLNEELVKPYGDRIKLTGPVVTLSASSARALRLVFHEMATNALKHGALSDRQGKITVDWTVKDQVVTIVWCEIDGPKAAAPSKYNFGSKLILRILKQLNAEFEPTFAETGYCYKMIIPIT